MERLINCNIIIDIESIEMVSGAFEYFEIVFLTSDKTKYKIVFDSVWDLRYAIENAYIDRFSKFLRDAKNSSVLMIENSDYVKYFESQVSGTRPTENIKNYILFDKIDTVIEVLTIEEPVLIKL